MNKGYVLAILVMGCAGSVWGAEGQRPDLTTKAGIERYIRSRQISPEQHQQGERGLLPDQVKVLTTVPAESIGLPEALKLFGFNQVPTEQEIGYQNLQGKLERIIKVPLPLLGQQIDLGTSVVKEYADRIQKAKHTLLDAYAAGMSVQADGHIYKITDLLGTLHMDARRWLDSPSEELIKELLLACGKSEEDQQLYLQADRAGRSNTIKAISEAQASGDDGKATLMEAAALLLRAIEDRPDKSKGLSAFYAAQQNLADAHNAEWQGLSVFQRIRSVAGKRKAPLIRANALVEPLVSSSEELFIASDAHKTPKNKGKMRRAFDLGDAFGLNAGVLGEAAHLATLTSTSPALLGAGIAASVAGSGADAWWGRSPVHGALTAREGQELLRAEHPGISDSLPSAPADGLEARFSGATKGAFEEADASYGNKAAAKILTRFERNIVAPVAATTKGLYAALNADRVLAFNKYLAHNKENPKVQKYLRWLKKYRIGAGAAMGAKVLLTILAAWTHARRTTHPLYTVPTAGEKSTIYNANTFAMLGGLAGLVGQGLSARATVKHVSKANKYADKIAPPAPEEEMLPEEYEEEPETEMADEAEKLE